MLRESIIQLKTHKTAIPILVSMIILTQGGMAIMQAWIPDTPPDNAIIILPFVEHCNPLHYPQIQDYKLNADNMTATHYGKFHDARDPLKYFVNCVSYKVFGTPKLLPIFFNIALMPLVYLLAKELTRDRMIGLLSLGAFVSNPIYTDWMSSGVYDQVWSFFLVLSIYFLYKIKNPIKSFGSASLSFGASLAAKSLGAMYIPVILYSLWKTNHSETSKTIFTVTIILVFILGISLLFLFGKFNFVTGGTIGFHPENYGDAMIRDFEMFWPEVPFLAVFTVLNVNFRPKVPNPVRKLSGLWILNALLTTPIIFLFSDQFQFVYRFVPMAVFMSIFIAVTIVDVCRCVIELRLQASKNPNRKKFKFPWKK